MKKYILLVLLLAIILNIFGHNKSPIFRTKKNRIFIIAVGIDNYKSSSMPHFKYAVTDAEKFMALFDSTRLTFETDSRTGKKIKRDTIIYKKLLINSNATKHIINQAFQDVSKLAKADDIFVFYFTGFGYAYKIEEKEYPYLFTTEFNQNINSDFEKFDIGAISPWELNAWLNQIQCRKQLIVSDVCSGKSFFNLLFRGNLDLLKLEKKERIFIGAPNMSYEIPSIRGAYLTYCLSNIPDSISILKLFDKNNHWKIDYELYKIKLQTEGVMKGWNVDFKIYYESDLLEYYNFFNTKNGNNRGVSPFISTKQTQKRTVKINNYALIIGTDDYNDFSQLSNPVLDAKTISNELSSNYNFQTLLLINPTKLEIEKALEKISIIDFDSLSQLLIFVAGHGMYDELTKEGYIVPSDAKINDNLFRNSYISHSNMRNIINGFECKHTLIMLDVCFGGTFDKKMRSSPTNKYKDIELSELINRKMKYKSRLYLTSGGKEYVPDGRPGHHSPFASKFLDFLRQGNKIYTFSALNNYIEKVIPEPRAGNFGDNQPGGDFLFIRD